MANEMTGALSSVVPNTGSEPAAQNNQEAAKPDPIAQSQERINKSQADLQIQYDRLMRLLDDRTSGEQQPISLGQFFASLVGSPESKYFSQSMGDSARNLQAQQEAQRKREMEIAQMRLEMGKSQLGMQTQELERKKQEATQQLIPNLYVKDQSGNYVFNAPAAQRLAQLTGKPEYVQQLVAEQRKHRQGQAFNAMFAQKETPEGSKIEFDKNAFKAYMSTSDNPLEDAAKFADVYKKVRPLMFGSSDTGSVFDAAIMGAKDHPEILALAQKYKQLEQSGLLDEEKAYKMAMDLTTLLSKKEDSAEARQDRKMLAMMTQAIHQATAGTTAALNAERLKKMQEEWTPQQKKDYAIIEPSLKAAPKAGEMLMQIDDLKRYNKEAPDGIFSSAWQSTVGAFRNSPEYLAAQNLKRTIAAMIPNTARLPGSASNLDLTKIEEGLGKLQAPNLDKKGREVIINEIDNSVKRVLDRTQKIQNYWEQNKKAPPASFFKDSQIEIPKNVPPNITEADINATAKKYGLTPEQVRQRLGI
jgi:hypothetical protein